MTGTEICACILINDSSEGSGTIDFEEFCLMMYRQIQAEEESKIPERDEKELSEAFRLFDLNGDGFIEWEELKVLNFVENQLVVQYLRKYL